MSSRKMREGDIMEIRGFESTRLSEINGLRVKVIIPDYMGEGNTSLVEAIEVEKVPDWLSSRWEDGGRMSFVIITEKLFHTSNNFMWTKIDQ